VLINGAMLRFPSKGAKMSTVPAPTPTAERIRTVALAILATLGVIGTLFIGRAFFVPIALALFFTTLLRPVVRRMEAFRVPAPVAAALVVIGLMASLVGGGVLLSHPARTWIADAPDNLNAAQKRLRAIWKPFQQVTAAAADLGNATNPSSASARTVTVAPPQSHLIESLFGTTEGVIAGGIEVVLLLYLLLAAGGVFLVTLVGVIPARVDKRTAVHIAAEVEAAVSRYLATTTMINLVQGIIVGLAMWALGMPAPSLWAVLTIGLEFIPYLGGALLVALLSISALTTFDTLGHAVLIPISYLIISLLQNNVASPLLYGNRLKLNGVAVLIAVLFWGFAWGVVGAFLAVPLLAAVKILCDHIESLGPLGKFLEASGQRVGRSTA
jgi:predicted PurR-regulated permease PerM